MKVLMVERMVEGGENDDCWSWMLGRGVLVVAGGAGSMSSCIKTNSPNFLPRIDSSDTRSSVQELFKSAVFRTVFHTIISVLSMQLH